MAIRRQEIVWFGLRHKKSRTAPVILWKFCRATDNPSNYFVQLEPVDRAPLKKAKHFSEN
jgi:hypothetical protein